MNKIEYKLTEKDYLAIMEHTSIIFKNMSLRMGDRTSLARAYLEAFGDFFSKNSIVLENGKLYKNE